MSIQFKNKIIFKLFLIIIFLPLIIYSQIERNIIYERHMLIQKYDWGQSYLRNVGDKLTESSFVDTNSFLHFGMHANMFIQNSAIDYTWNYNDKFNYSIIPVIYGRGNKNLTFYTSFMVQNAKSDIVDIRKYYPGETQIGHWGDFEVAKIQYETENFYIKYGRDYFIQGMYFYESLLFSRYQYPYDQLFMAYRNKWLEISSYYIRLNDMIYEGERFLRNINGHRVSINLFDNGYIALNELLLYTGFQRTMNIALLNPLIIYYLYQRNENIESTNTMLSIDLFYYWNKYFFQFEFILDDFMTEHITYSDLEPTKYGLNITIGIKEIFPKINLDFNHTRIANRVYSTYSPRISVERFIHENLPIGHFMGSNLYEWKSTLSYIDGKYQSELQFIYRVTGDDVLYSPYNIDHFQGHEFDDILEPGANWKETIPYISNGGDPLIFWGFKTSHYYNLFNRLYLNFKASYWFSKGLLANNFNFMLGASIRL